MSEMMASTGIEAKATSLVAQAAAENRTFSTNPDAALFATARNMELGAAKTDEVRFTEVGDSYIAQGFDGGILYVKDGDWTNIHRASWPSPVATPSAGGAPASSTPAAPAGAATSATGSPSQPAPAAPEHHGGLLDEIRDKIGDVLGGHHEGGADAGKQG